MQSQNICNSKWVTEILSLQKTDGSWGYFHTLSNPTRYQPITTEQALRRLRILGLTEKDEPIQKAIKYLESCLSGKIQIPDRREKLHDWDIFTSLMIATWLKAFSPQSQIALSVAIKWADIIEIAFGNEVYNHDEYVKAYTETFGIKPHGGRLVDFVSYYQVSLLQGMLRFETEKKLIDYIINHNTGIYYIYDAKIAILPREFASKQTNRYLSALELLIGYGCLKDKINFVVEWINENKDNNGCWDLGATAKDGVNFPLSDSWRSIESRKIDCTLRIEKLLSKLRN